jgi:hypothetical protein
VGGNREGIAMTDLTPQQIVDAIRRGMEETWRKFPIDKPDQMIRHPQPPQPTEDAADQGRESRHGA